MIDVVVTPAPGASGRWIAWTDQQLPGVDGNDPAALITAADAAMYVSKRAKTQSRRAVHA